MRYKRVEKLNPVDNNINVEKLLSGLHVPAGKPKEIIWQSILEKIGEKGSVKEIRLTYYILRVAASLILFALLGGSVWVWGFGNIEIYSPKARQLTVYLPDNSSVKLNSDTRISYNKALWFLSRKVTIEGEGLFTVKKGRRFDVIANNTTTSVLGTTFNVYNREGKTEVSCIEGKVSVKSNETQKKVILTAGHKTELKKEAMDKPMEVKEEFEVRWTKGEFYFNNTPIREVFNEVERQFDVDVFFEGDPNRFYTGYFKNSNLSLALGLICIPMNFEYKIQGNVVIIHENKNR